MDAFNKERIMVKIRINIYRCWIFIIVLYIIPYSSCHIASELNFLSRRGNNIDYLKKYYSSLQDSSIYLNGTIKYIYDNEIWQIEAIDGYILSNSKKLFRDNRLNIWIGEDYIQKNKIKYKELFNNNFLLHLDVVRENFKFYYTDSGELSKVFLRTDTVDPSRFIWEGIVISYYSNSKIIHKLSIYNQKSDTLIEFNRNETPKKMIIYDRNSGEIKKYSSSRVRRKRGFTINNLYSIEYLNKTIYEISTDYKMPIIEQVSRRAWKKQDD